MAKGLRRRKRNAAGFTLVEALAAGIILSISVVALGSLVIRGVQSMRIAREYEVAAELLDQTMTRIDLLGPERLSREGPTSGRFDEPYENYSWDAQIDWRAEGYLYDVTLTVSWEGPTGNRSAQVKTALNDEPDSRDSDLMWEALEP
jgi:Tfp pilus assembly protein PilV